MRKPLIAIVVAAAMLSMFMPASVTAHESSATDLNDIAYDQVWPLLGPGGLTAELDDLPRQAESAGGQLVPDNCTHHSLTEDWEKFEDGSLPASDAQCESEDTHTVASFQCTGQRSLTDPSEPELEVSTSQPYFHSDLENGIFEATGSFFTDVTFEGEDADLVDQVWFSYAHTFAWPASSSLCEGPMPMPGVYYEFYRGDTDGDALGGDQTYEIPINTLLVPDAPYGAVIRAMDSTGNTLGAAFVYANVNNYMNDAEWQPGGSPEMCNQDDDTGQTLCPYHDVTPPNGMWYQSDTTRGTDPGCSSYAIEYGEPLAHFDANSNFDPYTPPGRDWDSAPGVTVDTQVWGPGYCFEGASLPITVTAVDQNYNVREQTLSTPALADCSDVTVTCI